MRIASLAGAIFFLFSAGTAWPVASRGSILPAADRCGATGEAAGGDTHGCLGCHDGVLAGDVTGHRAGPGVELPAGAAAPWISSPAGHIASHPVGIDYDAAFARSGGKLRSSSSLPPSVRLEDGRVGCLSCHNAASPLPSRLALPKEGSMLCYACHDI